MKKATNRTKGGDSLRKLAKCLRSQTYPTLVTKLTTKCYVIVALLILVIIDNINF